MAALRRADLSFLASELRASLRGRGRRRRLRAAARLGPEPRRWLGQLERDGIALVPGYLAKAACERLRDELDALLVQHEKRVQRDSGGADERLLGVDRVSPAFRAFWEDPGLRLLRQAYCGSERHVGFSMANRIRAAPGNLGSGNGWHRDSVGGRRLKALVYLNDVTLDNGPLQYWRGSHRLGRSLAASLRMGAPLAECRFDEVEQLRFLESQREVETLVAPRGSLILADTTGLHRGRVLEGGVRYAMTNYYFEDAIPAGWSLLDEDAS